MILLVNLRRGSNHGPPEYKARVKRFDVTFWLYSGKRVKNPHYDSGNIGSIKENGRLAELKTDVKRL